MARHGRKPANESAMARARRRVGETAPMAALLGAILVLMAIAAVSFS